MDDKSKLKEKLKCTIEANKISRLNRKVQDDILKNYEGKYKKSKGINKEKLFIMINIIKKKQEIADSAYINQNWVECSNGSIGGGFGSGNDSG